MDRMPNSWQKAVTRYDRWQRGRLKPEFEELTGLMMERLRGHEPRGHQEVLPGQLLG